MIRICSIACDIFLKKIRNNFQQINKCQIFSNLEKSKRGDEETGKQVNRETRREGDVETSKQVNSGQIVLCLCVSVIEKKLCLCMS